MTVTFSRRTVELLNVLRLFCLAVFATVPLLSSASPLPVADRVLVDKSERLLYLLRDDDVLASFRVSLGQEPLGHKTEEGDKRTPEGTYRLDTRNPNSDFFLSIRISYPNATDRASAVAKGLRPGGQIMIHGLPNEPKYSTDFYRSADWTDGCIAVTNSAMIDIWLMTEPGTPIEIRP
ncbi:MAG: L,D-transpeptidase family protein [Pseudomonadota bacterium]